MNSNIGRIARFYTAEELQAFYARVQPWRDFGKAINSTLPATTSMRDITAILDSIRILRVVEPEVTCTLDGIRVTAPAQEIAA